MTTSAAPTVEVRIIDPRIREWGLPAYQSDMAAGIDLFACCDGAVSLSPGDPAVLISAGIALHLADPFLAAVIVPRSGLGHRKGLVLGNLVGVVDADYTGPVMISVWNRNGPGTEPIVINPGDRIAQMVFTPIVRPRFDVVDAFSRTTDRAAGGFGSTGTGRAKGE